MDNSSWLHSISFKHGQYDSISIEEKSESFVLFSFTNVASIALATLMVQGVLLGLLGKLIIFNRILHSPLSCPVNLLILVDQVSHPSKF